MASLRVEDVSDSVDYQACLIRQGNFYIFRTAPAQQPIALDKTLQAHLTIEHSADRSERYTRFFKTTEATVNVGEFSLTVLEAAESDASNIFHLYSRPLDLRAVTFLSNKGSLQCQEILEILRGCVILVQYAVPCLRESFLDLLIQVLLKQMQEMPDDRKLICSLVSTPVLLR